MCRLKSNVWFQIQYMALCTIYDLMQYLRLKAPPLGAAWGRHTPFTIQGHSPQNTGTSPSQYRHTHLTIRGNLQKQPPSELTKLCRSCDVAAMGSGIDGRIQRISPLKVVTAKA